MTGGRCQGERYGDEAGSRSSGKGVKAGPSKAPRPGQAGSRCLFQVGCSEPLALLLLILLLLLLVDTLIINTSYQKLPFGCGDFPDTLIMMFVLLVLMFCHSGCIAAVVVLT